jgi:pyruvate dehydrogenase E1 component alpha subunit
MAFLLVGSRQLSDKGRRTTKKQAEDGMAETRRGNVDAERMLAHYRTMSRIRAFEETAEAALKAGEIKGAIHLSIGQEAIASGVCANLARTDLIASNHRGHGHTLAKGASAAAMMAELFGRETGTCQGKGGSMHIADFDIGMLGANGVVGAGILIAVGAAQGIGLRGENRVVACFFGDGATEEGVFAESLNFAALKHLPVLFVCENNQYAIHTHTSRRWATDQLCARVATYGIPVEQVADGDVLAIRARAGKAYAAMRDGGGPAFLECRTYRWREHVGPGEDYDAGYRRRAELEEWQRRDQIARLAAMLAPAERGAIDAAIEAEVAAAVDFAEKSPFPPVEQLKTDVFA